MNLLDDNIKHSSPTIVVSCAKIFLNYTADLDKIHEQVYLRIKDPLITLLTSCETSGNYEQMYVILAHIKALIQKSDSKVFSDKYKLFYVKYEENIFIKVLKLEILSRLVNETNIKDILDELQEYSLDLNAKFSEKAVECIADIAVKFENGLGPAVSILKNLLASDSEELVSTSLTMFKSNRLTRNYARLPFSLS